MNHLGTFNSLSLSLSLSCGIARLLRPSPSTRYQEGAEYIVAISPNIKKHHRWPDKTNNTVEGKTSTAAFFLVLISEKMYIKKERELIILKKLYFPPIKDVKE